MHDLNRSRIPLLIILVALTGIAALPAARADDVTLEVVATDSENRYWFEVEGYPGRNPTLFFSPGDRVTVKVSNNGTQPHNLHFGSPINEGSEYLMPGTSETFTFTVPGGLDVQELQYWCDPHRQLGMVGSVLLDVQLAEGDVETPQTDTSAPGVVLVLATLGLLAVVRRGRRRLR